MDDTPHGKDLERVRWCLSGAPGAWDELVRDYSADMRQAVRRTFARFRAPTDGGHLDDIVQETFAQLVRRQGEDLRRYQGECSLSGYLQSIAAHRAIDWLRKERRQIPLPAGQDGRPLWMERLEELSEVHAGDLREQVGQALDRLPDRERLALKAFYWDGLSTRTIGTLLGLTQNTVTVLLSRARKQLRELLDTRLVL